MSFASKHAAWNKFYRSIISSFSAVLFSRLAKERHTLPVCAPSGDDRPSIRFNRCFLDLKRHAPLIPFFGSFLLSFLLLFREMLGPVPGFTYFSSLTFTLARLLRHGQKVRIQPRMLQRRRQRLHLQTGSLKSLLPARVHSLRLRHKYPHASLTFRRLYIFLVCRHLSRISSSCSI